MIGFETAFSAVRSSQPQLSLERLTELFSTACRKVFGLSSPSIAINQPTRLTLLLPDKEWQVERFASRSGNSAFIGKRLTGKPLGIIHKDSLFLRP